MSELKNLIESYIKDQKLVQIATLNDNQPWISSVFYLCDSDLNLYWISLPDTRHSQHILNNLNTAATVVALGEAGKDIAAVQMEGNSVIVNDKKEIEEIIIQYCKLYNRGDKWLDEYLAGENPHKLYKFTPKSYELFDTKNYPDNPKQIYEV